MSYRCHRKQALTRWLHWGCVALLGFGAVAFAATPALQASRPNIVFVLIDDAGFSDLGAYGSEIQTPNIDQIAKQGVRFTNFHTASTCESTRTMLQSGVDNHRAGGGALTTVLAENQIGKPGYEGYLNDKVHSLGRLMHDGGYATYYAGKWNLGKGLDRSPGARGYDRYIGLEQSGADNYEAKVYMPLDREAVWWEDGKRLELPKDFFSSKYYVDKMIAFIDEGKASNKPFFATVAFQAVHSPLQAPNPDIEKYAGHYAVGWDHIRSERYQRQVEMGLVPAGLKLPKSLLSKPWASLGDDDKRTYAKRMAVFAGMLDNADQHIGRLRDYLKKTGQLDNTVFIVMSDNGADPYEINKMGLPFKIWYAANFAMGYERAGQSGSYTSYGHDWAEVSNTPFAMFKGTSGEGGMRVPFIVSYPQHIKPGVAKDFAYVTDFLPTVLDLGGVPLPGDEYQGKKLLRPTGASMVPYLSGRSESIHPAGWSLGYEGTGGAALFQGDMKLLKTVAPYGDNQWHLYDLRNDMVEATDLSQSQPQKVTDMLKAFDAFVDANGVVLPPPDYNVTRRALINNWPTVLRQLSVPLLIAVAFLGGLVACLAFALRRWKKRSAAA